MIEDSNGKPNCKVVEVMKVKDGVKVGGQGLSHIIIDRHHSSRSYKTINSKEQIYKSNISRVTYIIEK